MQDIKAPQRYIDIVSDPKATSDDECDDNDPELHIVKRKPERSTAANHFIEKLDLQRRHDAAQMPGGRRQGRNRIRRADAPISSMTELPAAMPIDYYEPAFFGSLSMLVKQRAANANRIAFPCDIREILCGPRSANEKLSDTGLFKKFGSQVLALYNLADEDEGDYEEDRAEEEDLEDSGDEDDDDAMEVDGIRAIDQDMFSKLYSRRLRS